MLTRRKFLSLVPGLALLSGGMIYAGYRLGGCPLSNNGYCVGPCSAFLDDGTGLCLRLGGSAALAEPAGPTSAPATPETTTGQPEATAAPASAATAQPTATAKATQPAATKTPTPASQTKPVTACPFGLVNDKYPGRCRRYVDRNGNGYCDLSEPQSR
jgi:hypothetical protein